MSRIGKRPIDIAENVSVSFNNRILQVKEKHGILEQSIQEILDIEINNKKIIVTRKEETDKAKELHGLTRALIQNMVLGVTNKFSRYLIAEGVGYKFQIDKKILILNIGFTHPIQFEIPSDLELKLESPTKLLISGISKEKVGFLAAKIRSVRPPEPYKGKGLLYEGEIVRRKAGKTGK
jgi:large subunit ribosomal protein L6